MDHTALMVFLSLCSSGLWAEHTAVVSEFRLVGGKNHCDGKLQEKKKLGDWREVEDWDLDWTLMSAAEVCRQLDCGPVLTLQNQWEDFVLIITCSDSVRLVDGTGLCSGRLEVNLNQSWSSVSEDGFDQQDAEVVCRELRCGPPSVLQEALFGETETPTWSREFQCEGTEAALLDCDGSVRNYSGKAVGLTCSEPVGSIRLVGGGSRCDGSLELQHREEWRNVSFRFWTLSFAGEVCKQLDCGSPVSMRDIYNDHSEDVWDVVEDCDGSSLTKCVRGTTSIPEATEVTCSDSVRLVDGTNLCSGRLEVNLNQSWSSVCEADFDQQDAEVVCRELDCGPPSVLQGGLFGEVEAPTWSREFQCEGNESALLDCRRSASARNTCSPGKAVGLTCSDGVRLVGEASRCAGTLEMFYQNQWRPVAASNDHWNKNSSAAVCSQLGCGSVVSTRILKKSLIGPVWWIRSDCLNRKSALRDCLSLTYLWTRQSDQFLEVICSDLLVEPHIFLSSTDGVSKAIKQGSEVPIGSDFSIMCSIKPQYQGGSFQLLFNTSNSAQNYTLPAVNHSAHFLFSAADHTHQGTFSCVYLVYVFSHNFSSRSQPLSLTISVSGYLTALIIRLVVVLLGLMGSILVLYFYFKTSSSQMSGPEKKHHVDGSRAEGEEETAVFMDE